MYPNGERESSHVGSHVERLCSYGRDEEKIGEENT
jgi:hypothetical protein